MKATTSLAARTHGRIFSAARRQHAGKPRRARLALGSLGALVALGAQVAAMAPAAAAGRPGPLTVTPNTGQAGVSVKISGPGFVPGEKVSVTYDTGLAAPQPTTVTLCSRHASGRGVFTCRATIPPAPTAGRPGPHKILAVGRDSQTVDKEIFTLLRGPDSGWLQDGYSATKNSFNPKEHQLTTANVPQLGTSWEASEPGNFYGGPAVSNGIVYELSNTFTQTGGFGRLYAFAEGCARSGGECAPLWSTPVPGGADGTPAIDGGQIFVQSRDGTLSAYTENCGANGATCTPNWTANPTGNGNGGGVPTVADGVVYIDDLYPDGTGFLGAYDEHCGTRGAICTPIWQAKLPSFPSPAAVAGGMVYVQSQFSFGPDVYPTVAAVYAFSTTCGTGGATCEPTWSAHPTYDDVFVTGGPLPHYGRPVVANGLVYVGDSEYNAPRIDVFSPTCGTGGAICQPIWSINGLGGADPFAYDGSPPTVADGVLVVYISGLGTLEAYPALCGANGGTCSPIWTAAVPHVRNNSGYGIAGVSIANGVVYGASYAAFAVSLTCGTGGAACPLLWSHDIGDGYGGGSRPVIVDGTVYEASTSYRTTASGTGQLVAFRPVP